MRACAHETFECITGSTHVTLKYLHMAHDISISKGPLFNLMVPKFKPSHVCAPFLLSTNGDHTMKFGFTKNLACFTILFQYLNMPWPSSFPLPTQPPYPLGDFSKIEGPHTLQHNQRQGEACQLTSLAESSLSPFNSTLLVPQRT